MPKLLFGLIRRKCQLFYVFHDFFLVLSLLLSERNDKKVFFVHSAITLMDIGLPNTVRCLNYEILRNVLTSELQAVLINSLRAKGRKLLTTA